MQMENAIKKHGIDVRGIQYWSLVDNFEWYGVEGGSEQTKYCGVVG